MTRSPSSRCRSIRPANASAASPVPTIKTKRLLAPRARAKRKARRRASRRANVTTTWAGKSAIRNSRLTSGSLKANRPLKAKIASRAPARPTSTASDRADHLTRLR